MHQFIPRRSGTVYFFITCLLAFTLFITPLGSLAASRNGAVAFKASTSPGAAQPTSPATVNSSVTNVSATSAMLVPTITASKVDALFTDVNGDTNVDPGDTLEYTITIQNTGTDAAGVSFTDDIDDHTTLVGGSVNTSPIAFDDPSYTATGNIQITVPAASGVLVNDIDPDTGNNTGLTASAGATSANSGNVSMNADGSFTYNPAPGFEGTDTFTYTVTDASGATGTGTVTFTVTGMIWFVNSAAGVNGDGRLSSPFNCLVGAGCYSTSANGVGDNIFLYSSATNYTGGLVLKNNQRLIGGGATQSLSVITGLTPPAGSLALPPTGGANPTVTTAAASTDSITLAQGNTLRGFNITNSTDSDIAGNGFGTASITEMTLSGTGRALELINGTLSTSSLSSITVDTSPAQGILLQQVAGSLTIGGTTVSSSTTQGIHVTQSTADVSFGNTSIGNATAAVEPTNGVSLVNNSSGTRTFGTLTILNTSAIALLHSTAGGALTVTGLTTITNPTNGGVDIQDSTTAISFANLTVTGSGGTGVFIDDSTGAVTFGDLDINPDAGQRGLHVTDHATGTISSVAGSTVSTTTGTGVEITSATTAPLNMTFLSIGVSGAPSGIVLLNTTGSFQVTGDGSTTGGILDRDGSGGSLTNTTDDAVRLTNAANVTLKQMNLNSPGDTLQANVADNEDTLGEHGVEITGGSSNIILSGILVDSPAGSGIIARNITGTNRLNDNSLVTNIDNPATHGLFIRNFTGFNLTLFEVNNTDFTNSSSGASTLNVMLDGTPTMTVEVENGCIFEALSSQAITMDAGRTVGSTGTLNSTVTNSTFRNAVASEPSPGVFVTSENNVAALANFGALHNATISNNLFENIAEDGRVSGTSIIRTQNSGGRLDVDVIANTIQNINYQSGAGGRHVIGMVDEPAAYSASNFTNIRIENNVATNITYTLTNREFAFIDYRAPASNGDVKILGNNWNMPTSASTSEAIEFNARQINASTVDLLIDNNGNGTGAISNTSTRFLRMDSEDAATVNATVTNNEFTNSNGAPGTAIEFNLADNTAGAPTPTMCVNVSNNNVTAAGNTIRLNEAVGTMTVTQASAAAITAANNGAAVTVVGTPLFGQPACTLPTNFLLIPSAKWLREAVASVTAEKDYSDVVAKVTGVLAPVKVDSAPVVAESNVTKAVRRHSHHAVSKIKRAYQAVTNLVTGSAPMMLSGETVTVNGGGAGFTLPQNKTITIKFRVTVDNPPNLTLLNPPRVRNQGTVEGTNFTDVLTDDPALGGAADPTDTVIDLFDSQTSVSSSSPSIVQGDSVTFTATVTPVSAGPTPVTGTVDFFDGTAIPANLIAGCDDRPLSGNPAQATCTTTALTAAGSPHTITARYNADGGNYDESSGTVSQTVILVPDLTIDKSHTGTFFQGQTAATYTITVTNSGNGAMPTGQTISVTDTLPDGLTATAMTGTGWTCQPTAPPNTFPVTGPTTISCARTGDTALASLASYPAITLTVNVDNDAPTGNPALSNDVSVTSGVGGEVNTGNNSDTDPTAINAGVDLTIDKSHTDVFTQGDTGKTYTITVTNNGGTATSGTVTVTDTVPTGLTPTAPNGAHNGWTCTIVGQDLTCTRSDALAGGGASYPTITLTVDVANNAPTSVDNTANVANAGDVNGTNNSDTDTTTINQLCVTPPPDLVAWWTGDDTPRDIAGGNDGTLNGNAAYAAGKVLNGFNLDGTGDFVQAPDSNSLDLTTEITIDAWINPTNATPTARIVDKMTAGGTDGYALDLVNGNLRFIVGSQTAQSTGVIPNGTQTHVAVTYDGANVVFYINGVPETAVPTTGAIPVNALPLRIGADQAGTLAFQGVIDEVEIFSSKVEAADILAIFNSAAGGKCKPADLTITKTHTDPFQQGSTGNNYTITVHNDGPGDTVGTTTVTDTLPAGLTATALSGTNWTCDPIPGGGTAGPATLTCTSTDVIASGADFPVITLEVSVGANTANVTNTVTVSNAAELDETDNSDSDLTNLNAQADLQIVSKTDASDPVLATQNITYSISYINNGPSNASTVTVTDAVPAGTTFVSASVTTGTGWTPTTPSVGGTGNVVFSKATSASGDTATFQIVVKTAANTVEGTIITNTATAASNTTDSVANNSASATTTVNQSDIEITSKTDSPDPVNAGADITYTINFENNSAVTSASTVTVTDTLPAGTTFVSAVAAAGWSPTTPAVGGTGDVVFSKATVAGAETAQFTITVKVAANTANGTVISNTATAATASLDTNSANDSKTATTTVATNADLEIVSKTDSPDPVIAGQDITYTISFENNGPSDATGVTVTDGVPSGTTLVSAAITASSSAGWSRTDSVSAGGTGNIVFSNSSVPSGGTATFEVVVKVNTNVTTTISNTATADGTTSDSNSGNDSDTETTTVNESADLEVTSKTDTPDPVVISTNLTYTISVSNNGPSDAATVNVTDPLPAGTTLVSTSEPGGWSRTDAVTAGNNGTIIFSKASVAAGESATFTIVVLIDSNVPDGTVLTNTATASSATTDATPGNNSANTTTTVTTTLALTVNSDGDQADANVGDRICDVDLGTGGDQCTLRAAIQETNAAATADTIDFNLGVGETILLTANLPAIAGDLEIDGPDQLLLIDGGQQWRIFTVTSGIVSIDTLTITGAKVTGGHGAGLLVTGGDVTIEDMLFTGNTAVNGNGGAIAVTAGLLTILNSTISGNTATNGGGVYNGGGGLTMVNVTITANTANGDTGSGPTATGDGGGIHIASNPTLVRNTIIAGNTATTNTNVSGTLPLGGNNLTSGDPRLAPLGPNGGPTLTHALLAGSPAIDAGDNNHATTAGLTEDQRGFDRITDGNGDTVDTVDIGAFEAQVFVENIADRSIDEDSSDSFSFNVGGAAAITNVTATSSDPTVVPNLPANLAVSGAGGTRTLDITPLPNAFGTTTITVTVQSASGSMSDTFLFTVNPVNDPPSFTGGPDIVVNEDAGPQTVLNWATNISAGPANESGQTLTFLIGTGQAALFSVQPVISSNGTLTFTPAPNANGVATISVQLQDNGGGNDSAPFPPDTFTITVNAINDAPSFTKGPDQTVNEDAGPQSVPNWATAISAGPNESGQTVSFNVTNNNNALFSAQPAISSTGTLTYTPAANANGSATVSVSISDNGGTAGGGVNTSAIQTFNITVNAVNDAPSFTKGPNQTVNEDAGAQSVPNWATAISPGPADESGQTVTFNVTNDNNALFSAQPAISATGTLTYTPAANANGAATVSVSLTDNGGTANGGQNTSAIQTFTITVNAVNDGPTNSVPGAQSVLQNGSLTFNAANSNLISISDPDAGGSAVQVTLTATNGTITLGSTAGLTFVPANAGNDGVADATLNFTGTIANSNTALNGLVFTPTAGFNGAASLQIVTNDQGNTGSGGALSDSDTINITVNAGGTLQFSSATYTVGESDGSALITVTRVGGSNGTTTVDFATSNGTADAGSDYTTTTGTLTFGNGVTSQTFSVPILHDTDDETNQTVNLTLSNVTGSGSLGTPATAVLTITDNDPPTFALDASTYTVDEDDLRVTITVNRGGDLTQAVKVNYATSDPSGLNACSQVTGNASQRCDYATVVGTLRFAAGESSKLIHIPIVDDVYIEGAETFTITLSTPTGGELATPSTATVTINDNDFGPALNPISNDAFWIRQMYIDILGREPEPGAVNAWLAILNNCTPVTNCDRTAVALGFLESAEFQGRGFFAYRFYAASLGRPALYSEFVPDHARFSGFLSAADLELNKQDFVADFMNRAEFKSIYDPTMGNNTLYVDTLLQKAGLPNHTQRQTWINGLNGATLTRADVLRQLVDSNEVYFRFLNEGFVVMNYFGLLRRSADAQYLVWLQILNQTGDERAIVTGFINSAEYRQRFGPN